MGTIFVEYIGKILAADPVVAVGFVAFSFYFYFKHREHGICLRKQDNARYEQQKNIERIEVIISNIEKRLSWLEGNHERKQK